MIDLCEFIKGILTSPIETLKMNAIKHIMIPLLLLVNNIKSLTTQRRLLQELFQEDKFLLIILDACRFDFFSYFVHKYLNGRLMKVKAMGTHTSESLPKIIELLGDIGREVRVFSSTPAINSAGIEVAGFRATDYIPGKNIIDLWRHCWSEQLGTVLPHKANEFIKKIGLTGKDIIWYMQPHYPFINERDLSRDLVNEMIRTNQPLHKIIMKRIVEGTISRERFIKGYIYNLKVILYEVAILLDELKPRGRVVITSDHGELLGEYGLYLHTPKFYLPQLLVVPWFEVNDVKIDINIENHIGSTTVDY